jgi:hypothetical protein
MSDFGHFAGSDEEYEHVRKLNAEVVRLIASIGEVTNRAYGKTGFPMRFRRAD